MRYSFSRSFILGAPDAVVKDEQGNDCYKLVNKGKVGFNYELFDVSGKSHAIIKQVISFKNKFVIRTNDRDITMLFKHELKINGDAYCQFKGLDWSTDGDLHHHEYSVRAGNGVVARVRITGSDYNTGKTVSIADGINALQNEMQRSLEIECIDENNIPLTLAIIIAIELAERSDGSRYSG